MSEIAKEIEFKDIKVGDTIRITDVNDVKVAEQRGHEIVTDGGSFYLPHASHRGASRKFELVNRPLPVLPTGVGSVVELRDGTGRWAFIYESYLGKKVWLNTRNGARRTESVMQERADSVGGFEVIL